MTNVDLLLVESESLDWISVLPGYQQSLISSLSKDHSLEEVAIAWLSSSGSKDTAPFGGVKAGAVLLYKNVLLEIQKLLCGDQAYDKERKQLISAGDVSRATVVSTISIAVAPLLGSSAVVVAPIIAIVFSVLSRAGVTTACQGLTGLLADADSHDDT